MAIRRILLNPGHGLNNATSGVYDPGAVADGFEEAKIARGVCLAAAAVAFDHVTIIVTPEGLSLGDVIRWLNDSYRVGDFILSVHMNAGGGTGTEVLYAATTKPERAQQAATMSRAASIRLGIRDRGAKSDEASHRGKLGILRNTKAPALLIELGFIDNATDRNAVLSRGAMAVIGGLQAIAGSIGRR